MTIHQHATFFRYGLPGIAFQWFLLTLLFARVTRFITADLFPPMVSIRTFLERKMGPEWGELVVCSWCAGLYIVVIGYVIASLYLIVPLPVLQSIATMYIVGFLGKYSD